MNICIRISGRTFQFPVERSKFRSDVRDSGRRFEFQAELSKFRPDTRKHDNKKLDVEAQNELPEFVVEAKLNVLDMNICIPGTKISNMIEKLSKITKKQFQDFPNIL